MSLFYYQYRIITAAMLVAALSITATSVAQTEPPVVYIEGVDDASHIASQATDGGSATVFRGGLLFPDDLADLYTYVAQAAGVECWGVDTELNSSGGPYKAYLFVARNGGVNPADRIRAENPSGDLRGAGCIYVEANEAIVIGVGIPGAGNQSGSYWQTDPLRVSLRGSPTMPPSDYALMRTSFHPASSMLVVPSVDLFDRRDARIPTYECDQHNGVYQDQRSQADPDGPEARRGAFHVGESCADQVVTVSMFANAQLDCVVMNPNGSFAQARFKNNFWNESGYPEQYLPPAAFQDGVDNGAICEDPLQVGQTLFLGLMMSSSTGSPRG